MVVGKKEERKRKEPGKPKERKRKEPGEKEERGKNKPGEKNNYNFIYILYTVIYI
tara:strand:+ start:126 stop:290 length:165 start_codon:yes stop_codon:yes gene_type:complete